MKRLKEHIIDAKTQFFAFNIWDIQSARCVIDAASVLNKPVILQTSMKAFSGMNLEEMRLYVNMYSEMKGVETYLHLDHCKDLGMIKAAINNKWDSAMIDASDVSLEENIIITNKVKELVDAEDTLLEAEIRQISGGVYEIHYIWCRK